MSAETPDLDSCSTCGHTWEIERTGPFTARLATGCPACGSDLTDPHRFDIPRDTEMAAAL